ncbi:RNA polymerase subunit sigma-24 [Saccharibacillus sp. O23]|uniref:sigma-70 family RNA polymerase sigma factor n=1 Tax=Saccharibacillus sp. O23 TaxID=2009338 RepID=UPI000B4E673A|nr:sigma-70 family RNA polymerase sigma factor [Saccharibacillus sp. O23]OWR29596.1 RNA polymerase subunit sigma-24 [Saccharibacillus sp. O23]
METDKRHGEQDFEHKVHEYADLVLRLAFIRLGNAADAQDVCQEVLIKLFEYRNTFNDAEHEKAWIIRVTLHACRDVGRSRWKKRFLLFAEVPLPEVPARSTEILSQVLALPSKYRIVIHLHYYEGYRTAEIAELLDLNENTVRTRLKRGRERLKTYLAGGIDDEE